MCKTFNLVGLMNLFWYISIMIFLTRGGYFFGPIDSSVTKDIYGSGTFEKYCVSYALKGIDMVKTWLAPN